MTNNTRYTVSLIPLVIHGLYFSFTFNFQTFKLLYCTVITICVHILYTYIHNYMYVMYINYFLFYFFSKYNQTLPYGKQHTYNTYGSNINPLWLYHFHYQNVHLLMEHLIILSIPHSLNSIPTSTSI